MTKKTILKQRKAENWKPGEAMLRVRYKDGVSQLPTYAVYGGINSAGLSLLTEANPTCGRFKALPKQIEELHRVTPLFAVMMINNYQRR